MKDDPFAVRARHWTRWQRGRARALWHHQAHLDVFGGESRGAWLCSWQRSGSTWLAEVLSSAPGTRLVYEPANTPGGLFTGEAAATVALPTGPGPELDAIERALRGRVRGAWVDQLADGHVVHRRVVKDVRGTGLLGLVAARHPATPIVVLVRHPLSVATSVVDLGWTPNPTASRRDQLLVEVERWIRLHGKAFAEPAASRALVVAYEHLVLAPTETLDRVVAHLASHHPTWRALAVDASRLTVPSSTSFRRGGERPADEWVGTFDGVERTVVEEVTSMLDHAGLGALYGADPEPLVGPDGLDAALRSR